MSNRRLRNWLGSYMKYTTGTESARIFHKWVGISCLAAVMRKKLWLDFGRFKIYPNLYVLLVANPGIARKSQAMSYGRSVLAEVPNIILSADAITKEALLNDLEESIVDDTLLDGTSFLHASMSVFSKEFESFLGQKGENTRMIVMLTDLFDAEELPFKYRTKNSGSNTVPNVFINLIGATTPSSIASSFPASAVGGGLSSRIIFVWAHDKEEKVAIPEVTPELIELRAHLISDLTHIAQLKGPIKFTNKGRDYWVDWYNRYEEMDKSRICKDPAFDSWYTRKPMFLLKLAQIVSVSDSDKMTIGPEELSEAINILKEVEYTMSNTFSAVGRSDVTADVDLVKQKVYREGAIEEKSLLHLVWRDMDWAKFENVVNTLTKSGQIIRKFKGPTGQKGIWYFKPTEESNCD